MHARAQEFRSSGVKEAEAGKVKQCRLGGPADRFFVRRPYFIHNSRLETQIDQAPRGQIRELPPTIFFP
jgi:hypothetical protein